jgi:hypothetical protein
VQLTRKLSVQNQCTETKSNDAVRAGDLESTLRAPHTDTSPLSVALMVDPSSIVPSRPSSIISFVDDAAKNQARPFQAAMQI